MEKANVIKTFFCTIGAFLSAKLGILWLVLPLLLVAMTIDYITGILAAKKEGETDKEKGISSKVGMWGIVKKLMYGVEVLIGIVVDWLIINVSESLGFNIPVVTFFGLLIAIWLIFNEIISILENLTRIGTAMPPFLLKFVSTFKVAVEQSGDTLVENIEKSINKEE